MAHHLHADSVFVTRYRRFVFDAEMPERCEQATAQMCADFGATLAEFNWQEDHVHLLVQYPPKVALSHLVNSLKGVSSRRLRQDFVARINPAATRCRFWSPSYLAGSCGGPPLSNVKDYITNQKRPDQARFPPCPQGQGSLPRSPMSVDAPVLRGSELADRLERRPVLDSEVVFKGMVWDVRRDTVDLGEAGTVRREYVDHPGAVAVLALRTVDNRDQVLLIQQYRHPVGAFEWELPAGLLDIPGEPPWIGAARELHEEADLSAALWHVLIDHFGSPGGLSEAVLRGQLHNPSAVIGILSAHAARAREWSTLRPHDAPWAEHPAYR